MMQVLAENYERDYDSNILTQKDLVNNVIKK